MSNEEDLTPEELTAARKEALLVVQRLGLLDRGGGTLEMPAWWSLDESVACVENNGKVYRVTVKWIAGRKDGMSSGIHKATPQDDEHGVSACAVCAAPVKRVPGGNGTVWIHSETGTVVGNGKDDHE